MAEIIHSTSARISGLWFFDADSLRELDLLLGEIYGRMKSSAKRTKTMAYRKEYDKQLARFKRLENDRDPNEEELQRIKSRTEEYLELPSGFYGDDQKIVIHLKDTSDLRVKSFSEALNDPHAAKHLPVGFDASYETGNWSIRLESGWNYLSINVYPDSKALSRESFARIEQWFDARLKPRWQLAWSYIALMRWIIWFFVLIGCLFIIFAQPYHPNAAAKAEGRRLLEDGISAEEEPRAVELMLTILSDNPIPALDEENDGRVWRVIGVSTLIALGFVISFAPETTIGIGLGATRIRRQEWLIRLLTFVGPVWLFSAIVGGSIGNAAWDWIKAELQNPSHFPPH